MGRQITHKQWMAEAAAKFGPDSSGWRFVCPSCGHVASVAGWKAAGASEGAIAFSCVGRWSGAKGEAFKKGAGPCNYAGGGLFKLNPVAVDTGDGKEPHCVFEFADALSESVTA